METDQLALEAWWMNTSVVGLHLSENKEELKITQKNLKKTKPIKIALFYT